MKLARQPLLLLLVPGLVAGCTIEPAFERTNPFDPESVYDLVVNGPDSAHALGARIDLTLSSTPELPSFPIYLRWIGHPLARRVGATEALTLIPVVNPIDGGSFTVIRATAKYEAITFSVNLDDVVAARTIHIGQRVTTLDLSCSAWSLPLDPCDDVPFAVGATVHLHTRMHDPNNSPVSDVEYAIQRATVTSRDPSVVNPMTLTADVNGIIRVRAIGAGATWVVVRIDAATDSVRVAVGP